MTDAELIARLRASSRHPMMDNNCKVDVFLVNDAADRIEALSAERDRWKDACRSASRDLNIIVPDNDRLKSERDAAEAKLAKAVEALDKIAGVNGPYSHPFPEDSEGYGAFAVVKSREALGELGVTKWTMKI